MIIWNGYCMAAKLVVFCPKFFFTFSEQELKIWQSGKCISLFAESDLKKGKANWISFLLEIEKKYSYSPFQKSSYMYIYRIIIYVTAFNTWKIWKKRKRYIYFKVISLIEGKLFLGHNTCTCMCLASPLPSGRGLCPGTHRRSPAPGLLPYASGCICKLLFNLNIFYWINQKYFKKQKPPKQFLHLRVPLLTCASPFCNGLSVDLHHGTPPDRRCR